MKNILKLIWLIAAFFICGYSYGQQITGAEYFFDADPGIGNGTAITITLPGDSVDVTDSINITGMSSGFHSLFIRTQNADGIWSLYEGRRFCIDAAAVDTQLQIINAEYFFESDPGIGNGIAIATGAPADSVDITSAINTTGLQAGFHNLFVRVENQSGVWSLYEGRTVYINPPVAMSYPITNAEYFFDTDPGVGNGTPVTTGAPADSVDVTSNINVAALPVGFHALFVRVQNQDGIWSLYEGSPFHIDAAPVDTQLQIVNAEYFFDADPGIGNGTTVATGAPADSVDITTSVAATGLPVGFHALFIRVLNQSDVWSLYEGRKFYIDAMQPLPDELEIVNAETFFDADPGVGNGTVVSPSFAAGDSVDLMRSITTNGLLGGKHYLSLRAQNVLGKWSIVMTDTFNICTASDFKDSISGFKVYFTDSTVNASTYKWHFGDGDTSILKNPVHTYTGEGVYNVLLVVTNSCGIDSITDTVNITTTGINTSTAMANGAAIYPNPNNGSFMLAYHLNAANSELQMMDVTGRVIYSKIIIGNEGVQPVNIADLSDGIYYWQIVSENKPTINGKIVVVR